MLLEFRVGGHTSSKSTHILPAFTRPSTSRVCTTHAHAHFSRQVNTSRRAHVPPRVAPHSSPFARCIAAFAPAELPLA